MLKISTKKFDPQNWPEGAWADYAPGVRFRVRPLTSDAIAALRAPFVQVKMEVDPASRQMKQVEKVDNEAFNDALSTYLIAGWEGLGDDNGAPLPDNLESRQAILNQLPLKDFIWAAAQTLEAAAQSRKEEEIKN